MATGRRGAPLLRLIVQLVEEPQGWICRSCLHSDGAIMLLTMLLARTWTDHRLGVLECDLSEVGIP